MPKDWRHQKTKEQQYAFSPTVFFLLSPFLFVLRLCTTIGGLFSVLHEPFYRTFWILFRSLFICRGQYCNWSSTDVQKAWSLERGSFELTSHFLLWRIALHSSRRSNTLFWEVWIPSKCKSSWKSGIYTKMRYWKDRKKFQIWPYNLSRLLYTEGC